MTGPRAVLLDALGTLLTLRSPAPALRAQLRLRFDREVDEATAQRAMAAEIAFYRAHHLEGRDAGGLARLRARCTDVLQEALGPGAAGLASAELQEALLASLHFDPHPEVPDALGRMRDAGLRLVAVSNWDCSLHEVLDRTGVAAHLDGAVTSAQAGSAKPDGAIFSAALRVAAVPATAALHVGDSVREDVEGARAAGIEAVLVNRDGAPAPVAGARVIASLAELPEMAA